MHKARPSTTLYYKICTKYVPILLCTTKLASLHKTLPNTTLYYKACTNHFPILFCIIKLVQNISLFFTTKFVQSTSQYYFVLQSLYEKISQYYFVLQSLHKLLSSNTLYYKAYRKDFPTLFSTTKFAQSTSQYYFVLQNLYITYSQYYLVLQSLHKTLPNTILYYKACTNHLPVVPHKAEVSKIGNL